MQARIVETRRGARWLSDGWRLFRAAPLGWIAVAFAYGLIMMLMSAVPLIGTAGFLVLYPALTVGLMAAARAASRRAPVEIGMLFDGFRHGLRAQIVLGAIYLACSMVVFAGTLLADDDQVLRAVLSGRHTDELQMGDLVAPLGVMAALYTPMLMMFWFAPPLAAWHAVGAVKALFFSFIACMMNWRALLLYGLVTMLAVIVLAFGLFVAVALASGGAQKGVPLPLVLILAILLLPTLFASFYISYRDVFGIE
jgi:hypothetical protein